jgi:hypothetical protein
MEVDFDFDITINKGRHLPDYKLKTISCIHIWNEKFIFDFVTETLNPSCDYCTEQISTTQIMHAGLYNNVCNNCLSNIMPPTIIELLLLYVDPNGHEEDNVYISDGQKVPRKQYPRFTPNELRIAITQSFAIGG